MLRGLDTAVVQARLLVARWWVQGLVVGALWVPFGFVIGTLAFRFTPSRHLGTWGVSALVGLAVSVVLGVFFGSVVALVARSRGVSPELVALSHDRRAAALRGVRRGPAPADAAARLAALALVRASLGRTESRRTAVICGVIAAVAMLVVAALDGFPPVTVLTSAVAAGSAILTVREPRKLERRIAILED